MNEQLVALAAEVKYHREQLVKDKGLRDDYLQGFRAEHVELFDAIENVTAALQEAESKLRKATVEAYLADPVHNKAVLPGVVAIRDNISIDYNPKIALAWAMEHGMALQLDVETYKTLVKARQAPGAVVVEPQATIAREIRLPEPAL